MMVLIVSNYARDLLYNNEVEREENEILVEESIKCRKSLGGQ